MVGRASIRPQDTDTAALHTARPSWPGRGEKVAPHQEGGPARAPVPVLGATYAYDVSEVRRKFLLRARVGYTPPMRELAPGCLVAGYRIESLIGRGGMGVVYRAVQAKLDRV